MLSVIGMSEIYALPVLIFGVESGISGKPFGDLSFVDQLLHQVTIACRFAYDIKKKYTNHIQIRWVKMRKDSKYIILKTIMFVLYLYIIYIYLCI